MQLALGDGSMFGNSELVDSILCSDIVVSFNFNIKHPLLVLQRHIKKG